MVRRIYCSMLGTSGLDTSLKVKLLKLLDIGLSKFTSVGLTLGSVELKKLILFLMTLDLKFDLKFI